MSPSNSSDFSYSAIEPFRASIDLFLFLSFLGEVTPGLSQVEYALRRHKLMALVHKEAQGHSGTDHTVVVLSNPTYYMSNDIPYTSIKTTTSCISVDSKSLIAFWSFRASLGSSYHPIRPCFLCLGEILAENCGMALDLAQMEQ